MLIRVLSISGNSLVASASGSSDFETASRLDDFASAGRLDHVAAAAVASALVAAEQLLQQTERLRSAAGAVADRSSDFAAAHRFGHARSARSGNFAATSRLDDVAAAVASAMLAEQLRQQPAFVSASAVADRSSNFTAAHRGGDFATASRFASDFAAASRFNGAAGVAAAFTEFVKQAERVGVGRGACDHSDRQQCRNDYTTHRDSP